MSRVDNALLLRDTIQKIVNDKIGKTNPGASYATVTGFNPALGIITVRYPGDDVDIEIPAGSIYPSEVGQVVRIEGPTGSRVVADVKGENLTEVKARTAQETADGKNTVNYGETPPEGTDHKDGDIWFDEGNSNMPHVWKDGGWVSIEDLRVAAIAEAQEELKRDLDTVVENGVGTKSFYKPTEPTAAESKEGDLWFDTSESGNNELHTFVNGQWVSAADARIAAIQQAQAELASDLEDVVANGIGTRTHYTPTQPAVADSKEGDLWFDTSTAGKNALHVFTGGAWVSAADARLAELKDAQAEMTGDITAAQQKADEAFQNAADADSKAVTAQSAADAAADAAASAAGIANGKGKVLVQSTAPGAADRNAQTLWIDTTGGANTPKRWVSGTTWSAVTDKAATDAASAAATAKSAADAAKSAADAAQTTATNAQTAASNAQSTATEALTSANSKNTVTRSTANPTTPYTGRVDDIWWKMSTMSSGGRVIAQYRWSGTAWLTETIDNAVIANLDAAKITTGYLDAARIKANTLNADTVLINGSLGSIILRDGAITTPKIAVGAITAESGVVASLDAGKITVGTLDVARLAANSITADKVFIGSDRNMLPNGDLSLGDATGWPGSPTYRTSNGPPSNVSGSPNVFYGPGSNVTMSSWGRFPVKDGDVLMFECWVKADKANSKMYLEVRDQDGAHLSSAGSNNWTAVEGGAGGGAYPIIGWTVPTSWTKVVSRLYVQGVGTREAYLAAMYLNHTAGTERGATYYLAGMKLYKAVGSTLIEPGAITTEKIATGAITAQSGIIASLDAGKITVGTLAAARFAANTINADSILVNGSLGSTIIKDGAITTKKLAVGAITAESGVIGSLDASKITVGKLSGARLEADAINGMQIIGATIATSTSFPRVQLDNAGLHVYSSSTVRTFFADAATGDVSVVGNLYAGSSVGYVKTSAIAAETGQSATHGIEFGTNTGFGRVYVSRSPSSPYDSSLIITAPALTSTGGSAPVFVTAPYVDPGLRFSSIPISAKPSVKMQSSMFDVQVSPWSTSNSGASTISIDDYSFTLKASPPLRLVSSTSIVLDAPTITGLPMAGGRGSTGKMVANTPKAVAVTFPSGRFIGAPNVSLTISSTVPGKTVTGCGVAGVSSSGFTAYITRTNTTSTSFEWTAIETN